MKFKLDENIGRRGLEVLKAAGHDVITVREQQLHGASDEKLFEICTTEARALITLDRDFGQVTRFPPGKSAGIVVLDVGPKTSLDGIIGRLHDFLAVLEHHAVAGSLWIVEPGRVRIHLREDG